MSHGEQTNDSRPASGGRVLPFTRERKGHTASPGAWARQPAAAGGPARKPRATEFLAAAQRATQTHVADAGTRLAAAPRRVPWAVVAAGALAVAAWWVARRSGSGQRAVA